MEMCKYRAGMQQILVDYPIFQWLVLRSFVTSMSWKMRMLHIFKVRNIHIITVVCLVQTVTEQEASECWQKYIWAVEAKHSQYLL